VSESFGVVVALKKALFSKEVAQFY